MPIQSWHPGEVAARKARYDEDLMGERTVTIDGFPADHRAFYHQLAFLPLATLDDRGRPWISVTTASDGRRGFCSSTWDPTRWDVPEDPKLETELNVKAWFPVGDPARDNLVRGMSLGSRRLVAGVGLELLNRRRNKFAGHISSVKTIEDGTSEWTLTLQIEYVLGNCPKYINTRDLVPAPCSPHVRSSSFSDDNVSRSVLLPEEAVDAIGRADLVFLATVYRSVSKNESRDPSRLGANSRGGPPGFVRVTTENGRSVIYLPDYSGNRYMQSIGNIHAAPLAGLTVPLFGLSSTTQTSQTRILYLTGDASVLYADNAKVVMPSAKAVIRIVVQDYTLLDDALPLVVRVPVVNPQTTPWSRPTSVSAQDGIGWSPYNPPVWTLRSQDPALAAVGDSPSNTPVILQGSRFYTSRLATFTWSVTGRDPLKINPGQHVILDMRTFLAARAEACSHMTQFPGGEKLMNDDGVRSYTVSRTFSPVPDGSNGWTTHFETTLRRADGGAVASGLFYRTRQLDDTSSRAHANILAAELIGVGGEFTLPIAETRNQKSPRLLQVIYLGNGIGITPLLAHLDQIARLVAAPHTHETSLDQISLFAIVAARPREIAIVGHLFRSALHVALTGDISPSAPKLHITIHVIGGTRRSNDEGPEQYSDPDPHYVNVSQSRLDSPDPPWLNIIEHRSVRLTEESLVKGNDGDALYSDIEGMGSGVPDFSSFQTAFICGSSGFGRTARAALRRAGVREDRVLVEIF